jgi:hypothetical protein
LECVSNSNRPPFRTFLIPGALRCVWSYTARTLWLVRARVLTFRPSRSRAMSEAIAGGILVGWMIIQLALIGYRQPSQVLYLLLGWAILGTGIALMASAPRTAT